MRKRRLGQARAWIAVTTTTAVMISMLREPGNAAKPRPRGCPGCTPPRVTSTSRRSATRSPYRFARPKRIHENIPTLPASDWSVWRIYPRFLRLIGPPSVAVLFKRDSAFAYL
eukprot:9340025-Pyramimonas_sp.AAC.1